uniref:Uncharacterized protein n=1 Tax=Bionectria ochroleuca TaxID=29856 RepID=A0A0B7KID6_BIOOC
MSSDGNKLSQTYTVGGHIEDRRQPSLPVTHSRLANPAPLALLALATGIFLISSFGLQVRGVQIPNVMISVLIGFCGISLYICGAMEFFAGNTFGATVFSSYAAFSISYGLIFLPTTGITAAYLDANTGAMSPDFNQAIALYLWAWFILTVIYTVAAMRSSVILVAALLALDICLLLLAVGFMTQSQATMKAGYAFGYIEAFTAYWAGCSGLYSGGLTPFEVPEFPLYKEA